MVNVGKLIKQERLNKGLSLRQFAEMCNLSHSYIDKIEKFIDPRSNKPIFPTVDSLEKISNALGYTLEEFMRKSGYLPDVPENEKNNPYIAYIGVTKEAAEKGLSPDEVRQAIDFYMSVYENIKKKEEKEKKSNVNKE